MTEPYMTGTMVELHSGGATMQVDWGDEAPTVSGPVPCVWMTSDGDLRRERFNPVLIREYMSNYERMMKGAQDAIDRRNVSEGV